MPLSTTFSLLALQPSGCPAVVLAALRDTPGGSRYLGAGRGLTLVEATASCLGEVAEREALSRPHLSDTESSAPRLRSASLLLYSPAQLRNGPHPSEQIAADELSLLRAEPPGWVDGRDRNGAVSFAAPAFLVSGPSRFCSSNGVAAHQTRRAAEDAALLELAERDAVAIWWYAKCRRPSASIALLDDARGASLGEWLRTRGRKTHCLDLTHDLGVPVAAAVSAETDGANVAYGFAARTTLAEAALAATLEMLQIEISLGLAARRAAIVGRAEGPGGVLLAWSRKADVNRLPHLIPDPLSPRVAPSDDPVTNLIVRNPLFIDLDRPGDPLPVVRALLPGLRPWTPRFAPGRLFDVPRSLGWEHTLIDETAVEDVILI